MFTFQASVGEDDDYKDDEQAMVMTK